MRIMHKSSWQLVKAMLAILCPVTVRRIVHIPCTVAIIKVEVGWIRKWIFLFREIRK
jgi:hypothetical protein